MAFLNALNIVGSALTAERFRTNIITQNISNQLVIGRNGEDPYRRKQVIFQTRPQTFDETLSQVQGGGVRVTQVVDMIQKMVLKQFMTLLILMRMKTDISIILMLTTRKNSLTLWKQQECTKQT